MKTHTTPTGIEKPSINVFFSCGAASAVAAKLTIDKYGLTHDIRIVNNPVDEEDADNRRFLKDVEAWLGYPIQIVTNTKAGTTSAVDVWDKRKYMSGTKGAPCTTVLKKEARYEYELTHESDFIVMGFTADEQDRHDIFTALERSNLLPVLIDEGLTKEDCFSIVEGAGIRLPDAYVKYGLPNANCVGCVKATSPTYWNHIRNVLPDVFRQRAEQSRRIGCRLVRVKGKRIFLDELEPDAIGRSMKTYRAPECGIFCNTPLKKLKRTNGNT